MQGSRKTARRLLCGLMMALLLAALLPTTALAAKAEASATTMRVAGSEGTVTVKNASGQNKSVFNNMQLYNGWTVETAAASYATLSLDSAKAIKLGAGAKVELRQNTASKRLELFVTKGSLFFDVSEELPADQTMNIRTSNMVCGIRGTMGEVKAVSPTCTVTYLLDGETAVINTNDLFSPLTGVGTVGASGTAAGTVTATGFFSNLKTALGAAAGTSGVTAPATDPTSMLTVPNQGDRAAVYIYEGNYIVVPFPGAANETNAMGTPALHPVRPGDRLELGARPAAFSVKRVMPYAQLGKVQPGDISGAAQEYLAERPASLDRAVQGLEQNGSGDVAAYLQELTPETAGAVKAQEEQQAAANDADAAARNGDYQASQANKVEQERGAVGAKVDTWGTAGGSVVNDGGIQYVTVTYDIRLQPGAGGTLTADKTAAAAGETVKLTATPEEGYTLESLTVEDSAGRAVTVTDNAFIMPASAVTATAVFAQGTPQTYSITITASEGGSVTADKSRAVQNETVTLTVSPAEGFGLYAISAKRADGAAVKLTVGADGTRSFTMPGQAVKVTATFRPIMPEPTFTYASDVVTIGSTVEGAQLCYTSDGRVPATSSDLSPTSKKDVTAPQNVTVGENATVKAFAYMDGYIPSGVATYTVGSGAPAPTQVSAVLRAAGLNDAVSGLSLAVRYGSEGSYSTYGPNTLDKTTVWTVPLPVGLTAFQLVPSSPLPPGYIVITTVQLCYAEADSDEIKSSPATGSVADGVITFRLPELPQGAMPQSISVVCKVEEGSPVSYALRVDDSLDSAEGSIHFTVDGQTVTTAAPGKTVTLVASPAEGYTAVSAVCVKGSGESVPLTSGGDGTWTFTMPAENVTATASFVQQGSPITVTGASFQYQKNSATMPLSLMTVNPSETVSTEDLVLTYDTGTMAFTLSPAEGISKDLVFDSNFTLGTYNSAGYFGNKSVAEDGGSVSFSFTPTYEIGFETFRETEGDRQGLSGVEVTLTLPDRTTETQTTEGSETLATATFKRNASQTPYTAGAYSYVLKKEGYVDVEGSFTLTEADNLGSKKWVSVTMEEPQAYTITPPSTLPNGATLSIVVNDTPADSGAAVAYAGDIVMMDYTYEYAVGETPQDLNVLDENGNPAEMESRHLELDPMDSETGTYFCLFTMPAKNLLVGPHDLNLEEQMAEIEFELDEMKGTISSNALVVESYDDGYWLCQYAAVGETVKLTVTRNTGWQLEANYPSLDCMDAQRQSIQTAGLTTVDETEGIYSFVVPQDAAYAVVSADYKLAAGYYALSISDVVQENGKGRVLVNGKPGLAAEPGDSITMEFTGATDGEAPNLEYWCFTTEDPVPSNADKTQTVNEFGEVIRTYAFVMPAEDVVLSGSFARCYKVTVATPGSGQLTARVGDFTTSGTVVAVPGEPLSLQYVSGGLDPVGATIAFDGAALPEYTLTRRYDSTLNRYVTGFSFASAPAGAITLTEATMYQLSYNTSLTAVDTIGGRSAETLKDTSFSQPGFAAYLVLAGEEVVSGVSAGYTRPAQGSFRLVLTFNGETMQGETNSEAWTFSMPAYNSRLNVWEST